MNSSSDSSPAPHYTAQGVSVGATVGTLCGAFGLLAAVAFVIYLLRKTSCFVTPLNEDSINYPAADPAPPPITTFNRDVEGAVMVEANNRSFLRNNSFALTLVRSSSSGSFATDDGNTPVTNKATPEETITVANGITALNSPLHPLTSILPPRYPTEIVDNSTNSVYKLYRRRSSALVYGSSTYNTINEPVDMIAHRFGTAERIDEMQNNNEGEEKGVFHDNSVNPHSGTVYNTSAEANTMETAEKGGNIAEGTERTKSIFVNNEEEKEKSSGNEPF